MSTNLNESNGKNKESSKSRQPLSEAKPIKKSDIDKLIKNYRRATSLSDTKYGWVSAEEINDLLNNNGATGIRIYLTKHPITDPDYPNQLGFVLVATKGLGINDDYANSQDLLFNKMDSDDVSKIIIQSGGPYSGQGDDDIPLCPSKCANTNMAYWPNQ